MTLWCIAKSPLMMGGDMPDNSPFVEKLLTANEVLEVNQNSYDAKQLYRKDGHVVWTSEIPDSEDIYVAFFNLNENKEMVSVGFKELGLKGKCDVRDLWAKEEVGNFSKSFSCEVNSHGAQIFKISEK